MKKVLSLVLVLAMVLGSFSFVSAAPNDVVGTEFEDAVERLSQLLILEGYPDGTFKPENTITRAEFAAVVIRAKGLGAVADAAKGLPTGFTDVPATNWASGYVGTAAKLGIVNGVGNGLFAPNAPVKYEEAITMIMRSLGYEPAAATRGGYPYGYLILANEQDLLEAVKGTQGLPALRGTVAQLVDNALEIPMMIQVGYGAQTKWVVSGTEDTKERNLLDELGFKSAEGRVAIVNASKNQVKVGDTTLKVADEFDFNFYEGLTVKAWYASEKIAALSIKEEAQYVATAQDGTKIKLDGATKGTDVAKDAYLELNDNVVEAKDYTADYAKVVLNKDGQIVWAKGYNFQGEMLVEEVEGNIAYSYDEELSLKDYTLIKDGRTIEIADLEEGDMLFYRSSAKFAVVHNDSVVGEVERVYVGKFMVDGKTYVRAGRSLVNDKYETLTDDTLDAMRKEGKEVEVYFNFAGDVVLVVGSTGKVATTSSYFLVEKATAEYTVRNTTYVALDLLNAEGKLVQYDIKKSDLGGAVKVNGTTDSALSLSPDQIIRLSLNDDNKVTAIKTNFATEAALNLEITERYIGAHRLQDNAIVFRADTAPVKDYSVTTWGEASKEFSKVLTGTVYADNNRVVAVFAETTNGGEVSTVSGRVVGVNNRVGSSVSEYTVLSEGKEIDLTTITNPSGSAARWAFAEFKVDKVGRVTEVKSLSLATNTVNAITTSAMKVALSETGTVDLSDAVIFEGNSKTTLRIAELNVGDKINVYLEPGTQFVKYAVRTEKGTGQTTPVTSDKFAIAGSYLHTTTGSKVTVNVDSTTSAGFAVEVYEGTTYKNAYTELTTAHNSSGQEVTLEALKITTDGAYTLKLISTKDGAVKAEKSIRVQLAQ